jgi:hypothetical protein
MLLTPNYTPRYYSPEAAYLGSQDAQFTDTRTIQLIHYFWCVTLQNICSHLFGWYKPNQVVHKGLCLIC